MIHRQLLSLFHISLSPHFFALLQFMWGGAALEPDRPCFFPDGGGDIP